MSLPKDPFMLLSFVNTKLRDEFPSLESFCDDLGINQQEIISILRKIDYKYDKEKNQFC